MRVSARKGDPGFRHWMDPRRVTVELDGVRLADAATADEERGEVMLRDGTVRRGRVRVDVAPTDGVGSRRDARVEVSVTGGELSVMVHSRTRPGMIRRVRGPIPDAPRLAGAAGMMAGAAAEHLCKHHGDVFDPSEVAAVAECELRRALGR